MRFGAAPDPGFSSALAYLSLSGWLWFETALAFKSHPNHLRPLNLSASPRNQRTRCLLAFVSAHRLAEFDTRHTVVDLRCASHLLTRASHSIPFAGAVAISIDTARVRDEAQRRYDRHDDSARLESAADVSGCRRPYPIFFQAGIRQFVYERVLKRPQKHCGSSINDCNDVTTRFFDCIALFAAFEPVKQLCSCVS